MISEDVKTEMKPCPFCGGKFKLSQEPHDNHPIAGMYYIYHDYGPLGSPARECRLDITGHFHSEKEAVDFWNRRAILTDREARSVIPAGYKLVPVEPTQDMVDAAEATTTLAHNFCEADLIDIYKAMVFEASSSPSREETEGENETADSVEVVDWIGMVSCPCTTFEQDETCPEGYPSLLCGACGGKGVVKAETVMALAAEMLKVAEQVDELEDPFAAWESIELLKTENTRLTRLNGEHCDAVNTYIGRVSALEDELAKLRKSPDTSALLLEAEKALEEPQPVQMRQALDNLLYQLEPFIAVATIVMDRPQDYPKSVASVGGLGNGRDLRVEDFRRLHEARSTLSKIRGGE